MWLPVPGAAEISFARPSPFPLTRESIPSEARHHNATNYSPRRSSGIYAAGLRPRPEHPPISIYNVKTQTVLAARCMERPHSTVIPANMNTAPPHP